MTYILIFIVVCAALRAALAQDGVLGMGGFIFPSPQLAEARTAAKLPRHDLSAVTVELQTTSGVKLLESDCAPNGYYFIPVSKPGTYILQVATPVGWIFAPSKLMVVCTKEECADNKDVNFVYTGFQLQGSILGAGKADSCGLKSEAPSGVQVTITSDQDPTFSQTVESTVGQYSFSNLLPGHYKLSAHHPDFDIAPKQLAAHVSFEALTVPETFGITGYKLTGFVKSASGAVPGVQVLLYSSEALDLGCSGSTSGGPDLPGKHLLCSAVTDDKGMYEFNGVHCAKYTLLPLHTDKEAGFEIQPASQEVVVQQGHIMVGRAFEVTGFAVSGRVVSVSGVGMPSVEVRLNGKAVGSTDTAGVYKISSLQAGTYTINAHDQDFDFAPLKDVAISPGMKHLPDITVDRIAASGSVSFTDSSFASRPWLLTLSSDDGSHNQKIRTVDGAFTVKLPPGKYRLAPVVLAEEKARGLMLNPAYRDVVLGDSPVTNLHFTQARFAIRGAVKCLSGPCSGKLRLRLVADKYDEEMSLEEVQDGPAGVDGLVKYKVDDLVPLGTYSISVLASSYCWQEEKVQVSLATCNASAPTLVQKGYFAQVSTTHPGALKAVSASGATFTFELPAAKPQVICLPGSGMFSMSMESPCFFFGKEPVLYDTSAATTPVEFTAGQALVHGELHTEGAQVSEVSLELSNEVSGAKMVTPATADRSKPGVFRYQFIADLEAEIQLQPRVVGALSYPKRRTVRVLANACTPPVSPFYLKRGLFIEGAIKPAVEGVSVKLSYKGCSAAGEAGTAGEVQGTYLTGADGSFRVGPLYDDVEYDVAVEKTGYRFSSVSQPPSSWQHVFSGEKLASVTVSVDLSSALDKGQVLLSFSGDRGFRQNAKLGKGGQHTFYDMLPGTYYLRPQLREYQFVPAVAEIVVEEGGEHVVKFGSKRTAYSIIGTTRTVNGQPLGGVVVEAVHAGAVKESSISAEDGTYRIQGLTPGQYFTLQVRPTSTILKGFPEQKGVAMKAVDVLDVDFSTFPSDAHFTISGTVEVADHLLGSMRLQVLCADTQQRVVSTTLDASRYYQVKVSQPGQYILRLASSLPEGTYSSSEVAVSVASDPSVRAPKLAFSEVRRPHIEHESVSTSLAVPVTVATLLLGLAVWKRDFLAEVFQVGPALSKPSESNDAEWLSSSSLSKRRTIGGSFAAAALSATTATPTTIAGGTTNGSSTAPTTMHRRASRIT